MEAIKKAAAVKPVEPGTDPETGDPIPMAGETPDAFRVRERAFNDAKFERLAAEAKRIKEFGPDYADRDARADRDAAVKMYADAVEASSVPAGAKAEYVRRFSEFIDRLPDYARKAIGNNLRGVEAHGSLAEVSRAILEAELSKAPPDRRAKLAADLEAVARGELVVAGAINRAGKLIIDGGGDVKFAAGGRYAIPREVSAEQVYAHELGHAADGGTPRNRHLSSTARWAEAYKAEILSKEGKESPLSEYAEQHPEEGFAEFFRLVHESDVPHALIAKEFPKASQFFKDRGLWAAKERVGTGGTTPIPDQFNKRVELPGGAHADAVEATGSASGPRAKPDPKDRPPVVPPPKKGVNPEILEKAKKGAALREAKAVPPVLSDARKPATPAAALDRIARAAAEMAREGTLPTADRKTFADALAENDALDAKDPNKLKANERYVVAGRVAGKTHEEIRLAGFEDGGIKPDRGGNKGQPLSRQRITQIEQAAREKLGVELSAAKEQTAEALDRAVALKEKGGRAERGRTEEGEESLGVVRETPQEANERKLTETIDRYKDRVADPEVAAVLAEIQERVAAESAITAKKWASWEKRLADAKPAKAGSKKAKKLPTSPEDNLRSWAASEAGEKVRKEDVTRAVEKAQDREELEAYFAGKGLSLNELAEGAVRDGHITPDPRRQIEDVFYDALKENKLLGEAAAKQAERDTEEYYRRKQEQERDEPYTPSSEDIPFSPGNAAPPTGSASGPVGDIVTPARMNAEVNAEFGRATGAREYAGEKMPFTGPDAYADKQQRATVRSKRADQDPFTTLEEAAHQLSWDKDPAKRMPTDVKDPAVVRGMDALNAAFGRKYADPKTAIVEGYASWVKLRAAGQADALTGDAKAAAEWAEKWTRDAGKMGPIDAVTPLFTNYVAQSPTQRAQGLGSSTGKPVVADRTPGEVASQAKKDFLDAIDNDLYPAERLEKAVEDATGKPYDPAKKLSTLMAAARTGDAAAKSVQWGRDGVPVLGRDGRLQKNGPSIAEIEADARPEWLEPGPDGAMSPADTYHLAKGLVRMRADGKRMRAEAEAEVTRLKIARDAARRGTPLRKALNKELTAARANEADVFTKTEPMINRVTEDQFKTFEAAYREMDADPDFGKWAREFSRRQTSADEALLDLYVSIGEKRKDDADRLKKLYPEYTPTERVQSPEAGWRLTIPGKKGEKAAKVTQVATGGSGEAIVAPRLVYRQRLLKAAEVYNKNRAFDALLALSKQPGAGPFVVENKLASRDLTRKGAAKSAELARAGLSEAKIAEALKEMEIADAEVYFRHEAWPEDGAKPTIEGHSDGELVSLRVGDRSLYDLVTNQQVDAHQTARLIRAFANMRILGVEPVKAQAQLVRVGATATSLAFQIKNLPRDTLTFWRNTIDRATVKELPGEFWRMYGHMARTLAANFKAWRAGGEARGPETDPLRQAFLDARGDQLKQFAFERDNPEASYNGVKSTPTVRSLLKDVLNVMGAGELAPRFLEYKNKLKQITGKTGEQLAKEYADYYASLKAGGRPKAPLTAGQEALALNAAWEVTAPFPRQGVVTRQFNQITPFFGPAVAGVSKAIRNWKTNPTGALYALGLVGALRAMHWLLVKDEPWYGELSPNDKFNNFVVPTPIGPRRLPGPRDLDIAVGGLQVMMMDAAYGKDPKFRGYLEQSLEGVLPPGIGPATGELIKGDVGMAAARLGAMPAGGAGQVGVELMMNKDWTGKPIIPRRDQGKTSDFDQFTDHIAPYALKQLTGGRAELSVSGLGLNPAPRVGSFRESVNELYDRAHELEVEKAAATRAGRRFKEEAEYKRLEAAKKQIEELAAQGRGDRKIGSRVVKGDRPDADAREAIQLRQAAVARRALGK